MSLLLAVAIILVLFLLSSAAIVLVIGPLILLQPQRRRKEWYLQYTSLLEPRDAGLPQENLIVQTYDGIPLHCWLVAQRKKSKGTILYLHGVGDCKTDGVPLARLLFEEGYHVFLYDSRRHGESGGSYCTYGYYEKKDVSTVLDYLSERSELQVGKVAIFGTSMGAAVALQAAANDARISAVIAEASFTDLRTVSVDYQRRIIKLPWHFLRNVAMSRSQHIAKFKAREVSPLLAVKELKIPILFIHGKNDALIKCVYSQALYERANEPKQLLLIPDGRHNDLLEVGGSEYKDTILSFLRTHLTPTNPKDLTVGGHIP